MSHDQNMDKLVRMANQIATFFQSQPADIRAEGVASHINKFWEPRMRRALFEVVDRGGDGLNPLVKEASALIRRPPAKGAAADPSAAAASGRGTAAGQSLSEPSIPE